MLVADLAIWLDGRGYETHVVVLGYAHDEVLARVGKSGAAMHRLSDSGGLARKLLALKRLLKQHKPGVVHAHLFPALYMVASLRWLAGIRSVLVYTEHSTFNRRRGRRWLRWLERAVYRSYHQVICVSEAVRCALMDWVGTRQQAQVIENGIDVSRFSTAGAWQVGVINRKPRDIVVGAVGALRPEKNYPRLVEALLHLPPNYRLVVAGGGAELETIQAACAAHGVAERVQMLGIVVDVPGLLKSIDVYALVSLAEGFGLSALEAMASGRPVVYAAVPGLANLVGGCGFPVDPTDPSSIANGILAATVPGADLEDRIARGRIVAEHYDFERMARRYEEVYLSACSLLAGPAGRE